METGSGAKWTLGLSVGLGDMVGVERETDLLHTGELEQERKDLIMLALKNRGAKFCVFIISGT